MDYNKISSKPQTEPTITDVNEENVQEEVVTVDEPQVESFIGNVSGCKRLNIRKRPKKEPGNEIAVVNEGDFLMIIEPDKATGDWYKVSCEIDGEEIKGFCMKEFVTID